MMSPADYRKRLIGIWFLGFFGLSILVGSVHWLTLFKIYENAQPMEATVTGLDTNGLIKYTYDVQHVAYQGEAKPGTDNPPADQIKVGERLTGYFDADEPSLSLLGSPGIPLAYETFFVLAFALMIPTLIVLRASYRYKKALKQETEGQGANPP